MCIRDSSLAVLRIQIIFFVSPLFQMVRGHYGVLEEHELRPTSELLDFGQRPWRRSRGSDGDDARELKLVFLGDILTIFEVLAWDFTIIVNETVSNFECLTNNLDHYLPLRIKVIAGVDVRTVSSSGDLARIRLV